MSTFGDNLRKIRKEKNLTQDELAALLGTSKQVISRYENGQRSPKVSIVSEYADKLGVSIGALASADGAAASQVFDESKPDLQVLGGDPSNALSDEAVELLSIYNNLNVYGQQALISAARGLSASTDMCKDGGLKNETA